MAKSILIALLVAPIAQSLIAPRPWTRRSALRAEVAEVDEEAPPPLTDAQADAKKETLEFLQTRYFFGRELPALAGLCQSAQVGAAPLYALSGEEMAS